MRKPVFLVSAILILLQGCHGAQPRDQLINHTAAPDSQEVYFEKTEPLSEQEVISRVDEQYEQYDHVGLRMSRPTGQQDYYVDVEDMSKIDDDDGEKIVVLQYTNKKTRLISVTSGSPYQNRTILFPAGSLLMMAKYLTI